MTFLDLKERAARQFGLDVEDLPEIEPDVSRYVNEGYMDAVLFHYRPWREADAEVTRGEIAFSALPGKPTRILLASANGMELLAKLDEPGKRVLIPAVTDGTTIKLRYRYTPRDMEEEDEEPKLPDWTHGALADWATWRLYMNGNPQKQNRGERYRMAYAEVMRKLRPYGEDALDYGQFRNLYKPG